MSQIQQLYRLQQYDDEITAKKRRLAKVVQLQRETEALIAARKRAELASAEVKALTTTQTDLNLELGSVNAKAKRSEERMYSGKVTNPKELEDLQHEVHALGRRRAELEDEVLEAMILLEDAQAELGAAESELADIETAWKKNQASLNAEQNELALDLHGLMAERERYAERIEPAALAEYESIRTRHNGVAVVLLANNSCTGCHVSLPGNAILKAERAERVICNGCGRMLYLK
jgi:uncharacterized protein